MVIFFLTTPFLDRTPTPFLDRRSGARTPPHKHYTLRTKTTRRPGSLPSRLSTGKIKTSSTTAPPRSLHTTAQPPLRVPGYSPFLTHTYDRTLSATPPASQVMVIFFLTTPNPKTIYRSPSWTKRSMKRRPPIQKIQKKSP